METVNPRNVSMTNLEKLYSIIDNSRDVGVKLPEDEYRHIAAPSAWD